MSAFRKFGKSLLFALMVMGMIMLVSLLQQPKVVANTENPIVLVITVVVSGNCCACQPTATPTAVPVIGSCGIPAAAATQTQIATNLPTQTLIAKTALPTNTPIATKVPTKANTQIPTQIPTQKPANTLAPTPVPTDCGQNPGNDKCVGNSQSKKFTATPGAGEVGDSDTDGKKDKGKKDK